MANSSDSSGAGNLTSSKTIRDDGDMFPHDLEFIDDADVVVLADGSITLVTDVPATTLKPDDSQVVRETKVSMDPVPVGMEVNSTSDNSTEEAMKIITKRQVQVS